MIYCSPLPEKKERGRRRGGRRGRGRGNLSGIRGEGGGRSRG